MLDRTERHTTPDGTVIEVRWNARPRARTRHEVRIVEGAGFHFYAPMRAMTDRWWYPYDDQAMTDLFGLTIPDRYR